ncbi:Sugar-specific transcriptional regulator TrmB [Actinacidiphila yanglinensis]|uniref:Sugar-specific transcriptional regulator TrmB n=1 Tax=Actinacidiphila yanglinensis TaxID=310779 RepID=A0A1H5V2I8_9ACTN|nr:helix-turn-helix domain-containing protein [Actinacidiphila yanglinensis]SEF80938.1 Sugar-specific transcriptional regulator TrmB [Actinacidiphila yanglinensis]
MLEPVGLDEAAERAYGMLLHEEQLTVGHLAGVLDLPTARARQSLDSLVAAGLAQCHPGRPARYAPVDPRTGLTGLIRSRQRELERVAASVEAYAADYHERNLRSDPRLLVEVIEGPNEITRRVESLVASAEREILAFDAPPYVSSNGTTSPSERHALARGVSVRAAYAGEVLAIPERAATLREMVRLGEQARVLPRVPTKLIVVDAREAILPLTGSDKGQRTTAAYVRRSGLSDALVELFEAHWALSTPVFASVEAPEPVDPEITPEDRALLQLLNAGLKDEAIARQLDLSQRTFRRRIAILLQRLGATSRFQAGTQAMRRGWL